MQGSNPGHPAGQLSADGMWRWDGARWQPEASVISAMPPARISKRSWLATGGGIASLGAVGFILAGCVFPFVYYSDPAGGPPSASIFNLGYTGGLFYALEPIAVIACVVVTAGFLIAWQDRTVRAVGSGALLAFGLQTVAMFIGYIGGEVGYGRLGPGGAVGAFGGLILLIGGGLAAASVLAGRVSTSNSGAS